MYQNIDIFPWNNNFNTGVDTIDKQHQKLVNLLNKVASAAIMKSSYGESEPFIQELFEYAAYHFETEDKYWQDTLSDSKYVEQHKETHHWFVVRVNELKNNINTLTEEEWIEDLLSFLASWLASHILENDKFMALMVEAVRSGKTTEEARIWAEEQMHGVAKEIVNIILSAYKSLSTNTIRLMREIKTRSHTYEMLTENKLQLQEALDYAQIGRWSFPYNGTTPSWSPETFRLFGLDPATIDNPDAFFPIMNEVFKQSFIHSIQRSFETGEENHAEYQITRQDNGKLRWIECRGKVIVKGDGTPDKITGFVQDITERKENEKKIVKLAYYDTLTSLPNRRLLLDRLNQSIVLCDRNEEYNAILFIDIDNFKNINDSYGHEYGDVLLKEAAKRIQQCIRKGDTLARMGGDEFILILSGLNKVDVAAATKAKAVANKVLETLALPYKIDEQSFYSSASIGVVLFNDSSLPPSDLIKHADIAMYQAKKSGKNAAFFYEPRMQKAILDKVKLEIRLQNAIKKQHFELYYQPQIDHQNQVIGAEALIRWHDPVDGLIGPDSFIPTAEETGLIVPIGEWVMKAACRQLSLWQQDRGTENLTLSVNVSYKQLHNPEFVSMVGALISEYEIKADTLLLELTENMFIHDIELAIDRMADLNKLGVNFSIDDFGTGYSSLQYFQRLPLSELKIDRSFISDLESSLNSQSIVKTIILMANSLGLNVVAEGVEMIEQKIFLEKHGCRNFQGYLYSKPIPAGELDTFLRQNISIHENLDSISQHPVNQVTSEK